MVSIDYLFPNMTLFLYLTAISIALIIILWLAYRWLTRTRMTFAQLLNFIPIIYFFAVCYEVGEYLLGDRATIVDRLFSMHFRNMMFLIVVVGIGQVLYYFLSERRATT